MPTPLHDADVLRALADGPPGPARDWASVRLALWAPQLWQHLPEEIWDAATCLALGQSGAVAAVLERLRTRPTEPDTAVLADLVAIWGLLPDDPEPWIEAARAAIAGDGRDGDLWLARLLADLGGLDGDTLGAATKVEGPDAVASLPGLVLRFATGRGADPSPLAEQLVASLRPRLAEEPGVLPFTLAAVGVPNLLVQGDIAAAAAIGARAAGVEDPVRLAGHGSQRSLGRRAVRDLLDGVEGPAAALVRALCEAPEADQGQLVASAAWLQAHDAGNPLDDVLRAGAGEDRSTLSLARGMLADDRDEALIEAVRNPWLRVKPATALVASRMARRVDDGDLPMAAIQAGLAAPSREIRSEVTAAIAMARMPTMVETFLPRPDSRDAILMGCRYVQTEEALSTLLALPVPAESVSRALYAEALAEMADPAAGDRLAAIAARFDTERPVARAAARSRALLGR